MRGMEHMIHEYTSYVRNRRTSSSVKLYKDLVRHYIKECETPAYSKQEQHLVQATLCVYKKQAEETLHT